MIIIGFTVWMLLVIFIVLFMMGAGKSNKEYDKIMENELRKREEEQSGSKPKKSE